MFREGCGVTGSREEREREGGNGGNDLDFSKWWAKYIMCLFK